jgi:hypothetical protein
MARPHHCQASKRGTGRLEKLWDVAFMQTLNKKTPMRGSSLFASV